MPAAFKRLVSELTKETFSLTVSGGRGIRIEWVNIGHPMDGYVECLSIRCLSIRIPHSMYMV